MRPVPVTAPPLNTSPPGLPASSLACAVTYPGCGPGGMLDMSTQSSYVDGLAGAEDEADAAADEAAAEVVAPLEVAQRVLETVELAAVERALVAADQRRHRLVLLAHVLRSVRVLRTRAVWVRYGS